MKALVGTFNQEKSLVGAFSVIVKKVSYESFAALIIGKKLEIVANMRTCGPRPGPGPCPGPARTC